MSRRLRSIYLVAKREILERGRSRAYLISLLFTLVLVVGGFLIPRLVGSSLTTVTVGVVTPEPPGLEVVFQATADQAGRELEIRAFDDVAAGTAAVEDGTIAALYDLPADLSSPGEVIVDEDAGNLVQSLNAAVVQLRLQALLQEAGVSPTELAERIGPPEVTALNPPSETQAAEFVFANAGVILMFIGIFSYGFWVLGGVVEEKQSRVVEVVLSTVRPRDLLIGKVVGIGLLGLVQLLTIVAVVLIAAQLTGSFALPATTVPAMTMLIFWFILGFTLYATALGFLGSLASRMEEAQNAAMPVTIVASASYIVGLLVVTSDPSGLVAQIATFFPPSAPMVVPLRAALGAIEPWEVVVAALITLVTIWILFTIGARIYAGAVLRMGGRIGLRDAWRSSSD